MTEQRELTLLERMKKALIQQKEENGKLKEIVEILTATPLAYGTVLRVGNKNPVERAPVKEDFKKGTKVAIKAEQLEYYSANFPNGKVREVLKNGNVMVNMVEGTREEVAMEDLELMEPVFHMVDTITLSYAGAISEVPLPEIENLKEGDTVTINARFGSIVGKAPTVQYGATTVVKEILENRYCLVGESDHDKIVFIGSELDVEKGDTVVLDPTGAIIVKNNKQQTTEFTVQSKMDVHWEEIGGLEHVREQVSEMVELPHTKPEIFKFYNKKPAKGILLYGPPGCGRLNILSN